MIVKAGWRYVCLYSPNDLAFVHTKLIAINSLS